MPAFPGGPARLEHDSGPCGWCSLGRDQCGRPGGAPKYRFIRLDGTGFAALRTRTGTRVLREQTCRIPERIRRCYSDTGNCADTGWKPGESCASWPRRRWPTRGLRVQTTRKPVRIRTCQSGRRAAPAGLCRAGGRTVATSGFLPLLARNRQRQAGPPGLTALHVVFRQDGAEVRSRGPDGGCGQGENFGDSGHFCGLFRARASGNSVRSTRPPALPFLPAHRLTARPGTAIGERAAPPSSNDARAWPATQLRPERSRRERSRSWPAGASRSVQAIVAVHAGFIEANAGRVPVP
jgi:hypothetical protein